MLHYAVIFFIVALIAAVFGFGGIAAGAIEIAKILFFIFLVLFVVSLVAGLIRRGTLGPCRIRASRSHPPSAASGRSGAG